jgi:integrase
MSVTKTESGRWNCRYPAGGGKYKNRVFDKKREAEAFGDRMKELVRGGGGFDPKGAKQTVRTVAWRWYELLPDTDNYRLNVKSHIGNHLVKELGSRSIGSVTGEDLQAMINGMDGRMAATSIRTIMSTVKMVFRYAARKRILLDDPTDADLKFPAIVQRQVRPLRIHQVHLIAENIFPRYRALILFAAATGLRQGEVFAAKVTDIDWAPGDGAISVYQQIQSYTGRPQQIHDRTKGRRDRTVPVGDQTLAMLREHIEKYPPVDGFLFTNTLGKPLHRRVFDRAFDAARRRAAIAIEALADEACQGDPIRLHEEYELAMQTREAVFHGLRHFYASLLARQGLSPKIVAARLGHANATTTINRYSHLWPDDDGRTRDAADVLYDR